MSDFEDALRRVSDEAIGRAGSRRSLKAVEQRGAARQKRVRVTALASTVTVVAGIALGVGLGAGGSHQATSFTTSAPTATTSAAPTVARTPIAPTSTSRTEAVDLGRAPSSAGPDVPIAVRDGPTLLIPGGTRVTIGARPAGALAPCNEGVSASPDGRWVAFEQKQHIRVLQLSTRDVYDLGSGCAPVWGGGGLAYDEVLSNDSRTGQYTARLLVRAEPLAMPVLWAAGPVYPIAWVRGRLLLGRYSVLPSTGYVEAAQLADSPGHARTVPQTEKNFSTFIAAKPSGSTFLMHVDMPAGQYIQSHLLLYDARTLAVLSDTHGGTIAAVSNGVYVGDHLVAGLSYTDGGATHNPPVLYRFDISGSRLSHPLTRNLDPQADPTSSAIESVSFIDATSVAVLRENGGDALLLTCQISDLSCTQDTELQ